MLRPPTPLESMMLLGCGRSGGGAALLPPVASPLIWLDASRESYANNDPVSQFTDWSGNGNHFTANGTARPTFKTNRINSRPAVQSDGVDDGLLLASLAAQTAWTLMYVGRLITAVAGNIISIDEYAPDGTYILWQTPSGNGCNVNANVGGINQCAGPAGTALSYCIRGDASVGNIWDSTNAGGSTAANYSKASAPMRLFVRGDGFRTSYEIAELLMYPSNLGTSDRTTIWTYFNTRYGTAIPATP